MTDNQGNMPSLGRRVMVGATWLIFTRFALRSLGLVSTIILARLLVPEDFGLIALATAFLGMAEGISAFGFNTALIKFQTNDRRDFDTAWTLNIIRGILLAATILICSQFLPAVFKDPRLESILLILALQPMFSGLHNPRFVELEREMKYSRNFVVFVVAKLLSVIVTIAIAVIWRNYWAIIAGMLVGSVSRLILGYVLFPYLPKIDFHSTRRLFGFTIWISGRNIINSIGHNMDKFIAGGFLGTQVTGHYYMGQEISALLTRELFEPVSRALYPGFAKISQDLGKLRTNALESLGIFAAVGLPIGIGFAFVADEFVRIVLGGKWAMIIPMVQVLAPVLGVQTLTNVADGVMMSLGETKAVFYRALVNFTIRAPLLASGGFLYGFTGLYLAHALSCFVYFLLNYIMLVRNLKCSVLAPLTSARRSIYSVGAMSVALAGVQILLNSLAFDTFSALAGALLLKVAVGASVYIACHIWLWQRAGRPTGIEPRLIQMAPARIKTCLPNLAEPPKKG